MKLTHVDIAPSPDRPQHARLAGVVRYDDPRGGPAEETFWFDVPAAFESELTDSGNPWLAMLLPLAVAMQEPLVLSRPVDAQLLDNADDLMVTWSEWFSGDFPIRIEADVQPRVSVSPAGARTASFFSGGIDSFHTALRPRAAPLDDLVLVLGTFDLGVTDAAGLDRVKSRMQVAADALGKVLVPVTTNQMRTRLAATDVVQRSGIPMLSSAALALERRYARVLFSANIDQRFKGHTHDHGLVTQLTSTSRVRFELEGPSHSRVDKTAIVASCDAARAALRVCFESGTADNCMACAKCLRTAVALEAMGGLGRWPTMGGKPLTASRASRATIAQPVERYYWGELPPFCRKHGREDLARAAERVIARSRRLDPFRPIVRWLRRFPVVGPMTHRLEAVVQDVDPLSLRPSRPDPGRPGAG